MKITWERTVIGGETATGDFVAVIEGEIAGRIYPYLVGPKKGYYWTFQLGHGHFRKSNLSGIVDTKQEAADKVKAEFARWIEYPHEQGGGKDLPIKYWSPGSIAYSRVKKPDV